MNDPHDTQLPPIGSQEDLRRRMRAAMALAGIENVEQLAGRMGKGYRQKTLYNMTSKNGPRKILPRDAELIARACGLSPAFFTVDLATLSDAPTPDSVTELRDQIVELGEAVVHLAMGDVQTGLRAAREATERLRHTPAPGEAEPDRLPESEEGGQQ